MKKTPDTSDTFDTSNTTATFIDDSTFHAEVAQLEALWQRVPVDGMDMPIIDLGSGEPLVFVPILEHLEFVYARQVQYFSQSRRVILYRRQENRQHFVGLAERAAELRRVLDSLNIAQADLVGHGDAAMVLFEFAVRYPERCRSLIIIAQGADYQIAPHPFIWLLHELFLRLPVEHILPAAFLRRIVINYITSNRPPSNVLSPMSHSGTGLGFHTNAGHDISNTMSPMSQTARRSVYLQSTDGRPSSDTLSQMSQTGTTAQKPTPIEQQVLLQLPRHLIEEQFRKIALWPSVYKFSVLPIIHYFDMRSQVDRLTMPVLLINRAGDALSPEAKTRWLAEHLPDCGGYHVLQGGERFFMFAQAQEVNHLMNTFLARQDHLGPPS